MGYDSDECLICYTHSRGNNPMYNRRLTTCCFSCLDTFIGPTITGRVIDAFKSFDVYGPSICECCVKLVNITIDIPMCHNCECDACGVERPEVIEDE